MKRKPKSFFRRYRFAMLAAAVVASLLWNLALTLESAPHVVLVKLILPSERGVQEHPSSYSIEPGPAQDAREVR